MLFHSFLKTEHSVEAVVTVIIVGFAGFRIVRIGDYEKAIGKHLNAPKKKGARAECACYLSCDIGAYNTCRHLCKYCYANAEPSVLLAQSRRHDPTSPFLIGHYEKDDVINDVQQKSWIIGDLI